jgi:agmatine/peptidylarginine deiminase
MMRNDLNHVSNIILAYPASFSNAFEQTRETIKQVIALIPNEININLILSDQIVGYHLQESFPNKKIDFLILPEWDDLWMRDSLGFISGSQFIKPIYFPKYCDYRHMGRYFKRLNKSSYKIIERFIGLPVTQIPLVWDGGNITANSTLAFITSKVVEDNPDFTTNQIKTIISDSLEIEPNIIQRNRYDVIGHTDGFMTFINDYKIAISSYPNLPFLREDNEYLKYIEGLCKNANLQVERLFDRPIDESIKCQCSKLKKKGCYYSARGNYVNHLRINNTVILPEYTLSTKRETDFYNQVNKNIYSELGFQVKTVNCDALAKFGGSLHCLSYVY